MVFFLGLLGRQWSRPGRAAHFLAANLSIGLGHFLVLFNGGIYLPMIPKIAASLGRNPGYGDWTQDLYFLGIGLAFPLAPWVRARLGRKRGLLLAFTLFGAASAVDGLTGNYEIFLLARILASLAGGLTIPLSLQLLLAHYHADHKSRGLFLWAWAAVTPFAFGPFLGGCLADGWGWRWLFVLDVLAALLIFLGIWYWEEEETDPFDFAMDWLGYALLVLALLSLLMLANFWGIEGWWNSFRDCLLLLVFGVATLGLLLWCWPHPQPVIQLRLLVRRNLAVAALGIGLGAFFFQGTLALLVVQYQLAFGFSARAIGTLLLPMALFAPWSAAFSHYYLRRYDPRYLALAAYGLLSAGAFWLSSWALPVSPELLVWPALLVGLSLGALFGVWARIGLSGLQGTDEDKAANLLNLFRSAGQGLGIPAMGVLWERRSLYHAHFLRQDPAMQSVLWKNSLHSFASVSSPKIAGAHLAHLLGLYAKELAFNEVFWVAAWGFLGLGLWSVLARYPVSSQEPIAEQMAMAEMVEP